MIRYLFTILILIVTIRVESIGCTTAVISGKSTPDGRPLLWKNRDSENMNNKIMYFTGGKLDYIGLVNADDITGKEIWVGMNTSGFAIMNSQSYNLNIHDKAEISDREGYVIKQALQQCKNIEDFEKLLKQLPKPSGIEANFGVIDANGGAAFFETSNHSYKKYDVNDPTIAPKGFLIRTNFSFSGEEGKGRGYIRYNTANKLFEDAYLAKSLTAEFIIHDVSRSLYHSLTGENLELLIPSDEGNPKYTWFSDYIPRYTTTSSAIIQGIKPGEQPNFTTMYTVLGFPLCSVVYPIWFNKEHTAPGLLKSGKDGKAILCNYAMNLKERCFSYIGDHNECYINLTAIINTKETGILQVLAPLENEIFTLSKAKLEEWRKTKPIVFDTKEIYSKIDEMINTKYSQLQN